MIPEVHAGEWWIVRLFKGSEVRDIVKVAEYDDTDGSSYLVVGWYGWNIPMGLDSVYEWIRKVDMGDENGRV